MTEKKTESKKEEESQKKMSSSGMEKKEAKHEHKKVEAKHEETEEQKEHKTEHKHATKKQTMQIKKSMIWQIASAVLAILLIVSIFTYGFRGQDSGQGIGKDAAAQKALSYINENLLAPGTEATLVSAEQEGSMYKVKLSIAGQEFDSFISLDGETLYPSSIEIEESASVEDIPEDNNSEQTTEPKTTKGTFTAETDDLCTEDGKPLIMLFSTTWCPHCKWITETFDETVKSYGDKIAAYHWELDTNDNTLTSEVETEVPAELKAYYNKYNPRGSIPTFVFGCKYSRIGNGYESQQDLDAEEAEFRQLIDELLGSSATVEDSVNATQ